MFSFPWSNFHELNLDWILSVVEEAKDIFVRGAGDIQHAVETADQALETAEQAAAAVIADGAVTIPKVNDDVFNLMAFIVSGSVNPVAIPAGSLVILRKSTVYNVGDGIYVAASDIPTSSILTAADLLQPSPLPDAGGLNYVLAQIGDTETAINAIQRGLVTVVDGDTATSAVPVGALAYLKNNTHDLQEGLYANISNVPFPTTGGTADSTVFSAVPNVLNSIRDITGDGVLTGFAATDLTGAANELKTAVNSKAAKSDLAAPTNKTKPNNDTAPIIKGSFFWLDGVLVQALTDISANATFTENTNYVTITSGGFNSLMPMGDSFYTKFPDGTMICWGKIDSGLLTANTPKEVTVNLPATFSTNPYISAIAITSDPFSRQISYGGSSQNTVTLYFECNVASSGFPAMFTAVGRWK